MSYILIDGEPHLTDTDDEVQAAREALRDAGVENAPLYHGDPDCPDSYRDSVQILWAAEAPLCSKCAGSGEGMYDGSTCSACGGSGEERDREAEHDLEDLRADYFLDQERDRAMMASVEDRGFEADDDLPF